MSSSGDQSWLENFSRFVEAISGLHFPKERWADLEAELAKAAGDFGCDSAAQCAERLRAGRIGEEALDSFLARLTVGETYFFRDEPAFAALENAVLPQLAAARGHTTRRLRIWSAGCCTGEEPYSIGIALRRALPDLATWDVRILGSDLNPHFLEVARKGVFTRWAFRTTPEAVRREYFQQLGPDQYQIAPEIRRMVSFAQLNLAEDIYPSLLNNTYAMDLIFCRNVLMYFTRSRAQQIVSRLAAALAPDGWLFPSGAEVSRELFAQFASTELPGVLVYRRKRVVVSAPQKVPPPVRVREQPPEPPPLEPEPEETGSLSARARQLANEGRFDEALAVCDRMKKTEKLAPQYHFLRGIILEAKDLPEEAAQSLRSALFLDPQFVIAHYAFGNLLRRRGRSAEAARSFANVRRLLSGYEPESTVPESDELTAKRLLSMLDFATARQDPVPSP